MSEYARNDSPPPTGPHLKIFRVRAKEKMTFLIYGKVAKGFGTHWTGVRTSPCTMPLEKCTGHLEGWPYRWKAYLHVHCYETQEEGFLELTGLARDSLLSQMSGNGLRGQMISVERGGGMKTRLRVRVLGEWSEADRGPLLAEKDPEDTLRSLWEFKRK